MRQVLQFDEANSILNPYYDKIKECISLAFNDHLEFKNYLIEKGQLVLLKNRTKGSLIHDFLQSRLTNAFIDEPEVSVTNCKGVFGLLFKNKIFIRFNKMDSSFGVSLAKTHQLNNFMNQYDIDGFPERATFIWGGYNPDMLWSKINGFYLACFNGSLNWYYDMDKYSVEQLSFELPDLLQEETNKRRVTVKNPREIQETGTDNK